MGKAARWFKGLFGVKKGKERDSANLNADSSDSINGDKRRSFAGKPGKGGTDLRNQIQRNSITQADPAWFRSYLAETEEEQNKHAIAVAAATAAAADAAVAAAQAAVAVVRLTSNGRGAVSGGRREKFAAMKIQAFFRGYLARKAHRALKGLVKLQALVRGFLVRKRAAATLHSMQALIRAQTSVRSQRINRSLNSRDSTNMFQSRRSIERYEDSRSEIHSKRMSAQFELNNNSHDENSPKIVEIDTYKPRSRSRRINIAAAAAALSECGEEIIHYQENSPQDFDLCFNPDKLKFSTAQSTPRFSNPANFYPPPSPAKSVCGDGCFRPTNYGFTPSYMAKTQSFQAKLRSHSAPRQRPERKRLSLDEIMAARNSISGVKMQRSSCSSYYQYQEEDCRL